MSDRIDLGGAHMHAGVAEAVIEVLQSGWPGPGPRAERFERAFAEYCGGKFPVVVNSGTAALHLAVRLLGLDVGSEVITTPNTFVATNQVLLYEGLVPVFADIEANTGNVCVKSMAGLVNSNTGALMVVHYAGYPCDLDAVYKLAALHDLQVVEDCAHAVGASYRNRKIGSHSGLQAFSFQSTKNLSAVDGGMLFTRNAEEAIKAKRMRWMGISSPTHERTQNGIAENSYTVEELGHRYAMSDLNAAIALVQLDHVDEGNTRRGDIAARYTSAFSSLSSVTTLHRSDDRVCSHHLYPILSIRRDELAVALRARNIVTGKHYPLNTHFGIFTAATLPQAEQFSSRVLTLPIHLGLTDSDVDRVIEAIIELA